MNLSVAILGGSMTAGHFMAELNTTYNKTDIPCKLMHEGEVDWRSCAFPVRFK